MLLTGSVVRARVRATGRVQGVYYRQSTVRAAAELGLAGWVRNLPDGSVEAAIEGDRPAVERLIAFMEHGPPRAAVGELDVTWEQPQGESAFSIAW